MSEDTGGDYLEAKFQEFRDRKEQLEETVNHGDEVADDSYELQERKLVDSLNFLYNIRGALEGEDLESFRKSTEKHLSQIEELKTEAEEDSGYEFKDLDIALQRHRVALREPRYLQ